MSLRMRAVEQVWNKHFTDLFVDTDSAVMALKRIAEAAGTNWATFDYTDVVVVHIEDGNAFLEYLEKAELNPEDMFFYDAEDESTQSNRAALLEILKRLATRWRSSIDRADGCLRIYVDQ